MDDWEVLQDYRWAVRERDAMAAQLRELMGEQWERPDVHGLYNVLMAREARRKAFAEALGKQEERLASLTGALETVLTRVRCARTRLVLRQYYALGWTDARIAEENGFSTRTANQIRNDWLRCQGVEPRPRLRDVAPAARQTKGG